MFDREIFLKAVKEYKERFKDFVWKKERYKWVAVQNFQKNWDIEATNFHDMMEKSLEKTHNLLTSNNHFPKLMILRYAEKDPETVRMMFRDLFDEGVSVEERIDKFKASAAKLQENLDFLGKSHYQTENAITTYLWLRYPDKYYIYKFSEKVSVSNKLKSDYSFMRGSYSQNIRNSINLYDDICEELKKDKELIEILKSQLDEYCYPDPELKTLTVDFGFYVSRYFLEKTEVDFWIPLNYSPDLTKEDWIELINNSDIFRQSSLQIMRRIKDIGGSATCKQLSEKYGQTINFYNSGSSSLAKRIAMEKELKPDYKETGENRWWPILYKGRFANEKQSGMFVWKLREELSEALDEVDLKEVELYEKSHLKAETIEKYSKSDFLREVYMEEANYDSLVTLIKNKKNIILQGAPGVGKTFTAKRLAYSIMGEKDESRIEFIQFHQNYSYEDFIMGYKPHKDGFKLTNGVFYNFCKKASNESYERDYFFIIDEINRGNMSKIFGEILMAIENDYRDKTVTLAYSGEGFSVPKNLHIIAMMNTADRSLAMIDYALRRRFSFYTMEPGFNTEGFKGYQKSLNNEIFNDLINEVIRLNRDIREDDSLGEGFQIGHSYFCGQKICTDDWMRNVVDFEIIPLLKEYWFDEKEKVEYWDNVLYGVLNG